MKKYIVRIVISLFILWGSINVLPVNAQNEDRIDAIEAEIATLVAELKSLQSEIIEYEPDVKLPNGNVVAEIKEVALTRNRYEFEETTYNHVIKVEYDLHNFTSEEYRTRHDIEVYVNNIKAEHYYNLDEIKQETVSAGRSINLLIYYGTNETPDNVEIEFKELFADTTPTIMKVGSLY